jgi:hypothetical protein
MKSLVTKPIHAVLVDGTNLVPMSRMHYHLASKLTNNGDRPNNTTTHRMDTEQGLHKSGGRSSVAHAQGPTPPCMHAAHVGAGPHLLAASGIAMVMPCSEEGGGGSELMWE